MGGCYKRQFYGWRVLPLQGTHDGRSTAASTTAALHKPPHPSTVHPIPFGLGLGLASPPLRPQHSVF